MIRWRRGKESIGNRGNTRHQTKSRLGQRGELLTRRPNPGNRGGYNTCHKQDKDQEEELHVCLWVWMYKYVCTHMCIVGVCVFGNVSWENREILGNMKLFTSTDWEEWRAQKELTRLLLFSSASLPVFHLCYTWVLSVRPQGRMRKSSNDR